VNTWHYDAAGNLLNDGTAAYTYAALEHFSRILQATHGTARTDYVYGHERLFATSGNAAFKRWFGECRSTVYRQA